MNQLTRLSTPFLKALLYSYKVGPEEAVNRYNVVASEFMEIYSKYVSDLRSVSFRETLMGLLLGRGEAPEDIAELIVWRDFEHLVYKFFEAFGYDVLRNIRITDYRYEIDVLVRNLFGKFCLVVECKQWNKVLYRSNVEKIVNGLMSKARLIKKTGSWGCGSVIPIIVTLRRGYLRIYDGVPIVSINLLKELVKDLATLVYSGEVRII